MNKFKKVTRKEFDEFLKNYPNKLEWDVTGISDPPIGSHNDFTIAKAWPGSMVAKVYLNETRGEPSKYYIIKKIKKTDPKKAKESSTRKKIIKIDPRKISLIIAGKKTTPVVDNGIEYIH